MNDLVPHTLTGEVYGPKDRVTVIGRPKLGKAGGVRKDFPPGHTVAELLDMALGDKRSSISDYLTCVDGQPIPIDWRERVRVRAGHTMTFSPALRGGNFREIALIAVAVVAIAASIFLAPLVGPFAASLIGAGIAFGGSLAINALFPIAPPKTSALEDARAGASTAFAITGARNTADPYAPIPVIFGRVRVFPRYAALPYRTFKGVDQFLRLLFCVGYGPLTISDLKIGETDIDNFEDVQTEVFEGYEDDTDPTLYPGQVFEEALSIELTEDVSWQTRTTAAEINEISVDIMAPGGWFEQDTETGKYRSRRLRVQAEYRISGSADPWTELGEYDEETKKKQPFRIGLETTVTRGPAYDVRVRKASNDSDETNVQEDLVWISMRAFRNDKPIYFHKPLALVALKIKASGQLNNVIDTFNCLIDAKVNHFNGVSWTGDASPGDWVASRNPADAFRHALQGPGIFEPVPDEQLDLDSLEGWWQYCEDEGWEYNKEHDQRESVFDTLRMICASGRARVTRTDGLWGVIWDEDDVPIAQHFTPRNSWGFEEQRTYFNPPHAIRVNFVNEQKGYIADERKVYDDGFDSTNATRFEAFEFPGVTHPDNIYRLARFQMAQAQLRPATYSLITNWQALSCTVGSRVYAAHDVTLWGNTQGRITHVAGDVLTVDDEVIFESGVEYQLRFRKADGTSVLREVVQPPALGGTNTVTLTASALPDPVEGDLFMFGNDVQGPAVLLRVLDIEWMPDLTARLTLVDDAPEISDADTGEIPAFDSQITIPADLFLQPPTDLRVAERTYIEQEVGRSAALLSWLANTVRAQGFEVQMRDDAIGTWTTIGLLGPDQLSMEVLDLDAGTYSFRVRSLFGGRSWSEWAVANSNTFFGLSRPADVTNFRISIVGDVATLTWNAIRGMHHYTLRYSPMTTNVSWQTSVELLLQVFGATVQVAAANGTYLIKAVSVDGLESLNPATIIASGAGLTNLNQVATVSEPLGSPGWAGHHLGTEVSGSNNLILTPGSPAFYEPPYPSDFPTLPTGVLGVGQYIFHDQIIDLVEIFTSRVSAVVNAFGENTSNVMSSWITLSSVLTLSGSLEADWGVLLQEQHVSGLPLYDRTTGTNIGNMTAGGGLAGAFDGDSTELASTSAARATVSDGYVGKTFAAPTAIAEVIVHPSTDQGFFTGTNIKIDLYGKTGGAPANSTDGTLLGTFTGADSTSPQRIVSSDTSTLWNHGWVRLSDAAAGSPFNFRVAELEISSFEWSDWNNVRISDITAQGFRFRIFLYTLNADIVPTVDSVEITIDMPDRVYPIGDLVVPNTGSTVTFVPPFQHLETVVVTAIQDAVSGDRVIVSSKDEEGFNIEVRNAANTLVQRTVDLVAHGYGRRVT